MPREVAHSTPLPGQRTRKTALRDQRVLVLHNIYREPGGEERYVRQLAEMLSRHAADVRLIERSSDSLGAAAASIGMLHGGLRAREVADAVREMNATVVHAHNVHPALGWRSLAAAREAGARVVLHLHNYRLFCAIGIAYRNGRDCTECAPRRMRHGLAHNCRGSLPQAAVYAAGLSRAQPHIVECVDRFIAPAGNLARDLAALGLDLPVTVVPTWLPADEFVTRSQAGRGEYALYAGRLAAEKGVLTAVRASAISGVPLRVAGSGPDGARAIKLARDLGAPVEFMGRIDGQALVAARMGAAFAVLPSEWREVLPFSALEALAGGLPLVVSDRGGLPELTEAAFVFRAGDADALAARMRELFDDPAERSAAGERALARATGEFGEERFAERLAAVYAGAA